MTLDLFGGGLHPAVATALEAGNRMMELVGSNFVAAIARDADNVEPNNYYPTPPCATLTLCAVEQFAGAIWEPACGEGHMVRALESMGHRVVATDLVDYGFGTSGVDFLDFTAGRANAIENIVTNPPYDLARQFIVKALTLATGKVCMLLRLGALAGQKNGALFNGTPLARVHVFSRRIPMQRGRLATDDDAQGMIDFAWFVWDMAHPVDQPPAVTFVDWQVAIADLVPIGE